MSTASQEQVATSRWVVEWNIWRCPKCRWDLKAEGFSVTALACPRCRARFPIEDEILITANGAEVITKAVPKDPDEIERRMQAKRADAR